MMTHNTLLTRDSRENKVYLLGMGSRRTLTADAMRKKKRERWLQHCPLSYDQACCIHPPFVECYAMQAFPKLMPKEKYQITMRKVCIVIQSLLSRRPHHHSGYSLDQEKHHMLLTLKRRQSVVYDVTNVEQHGFDASRPLPDVIPEQTNSLAIIEGVLSRFFQTTASANTIGHVCQAFSEVQAKKGQRDTCKRPGEPEHGIVQEARTWHLIPVGADLLRRSAAPLTERVRSGAHH